MWYKFFGALLLLGAAACNGRTEVLDNGQNDDIRTAQAIHFQVMMQHMQAFHEHFGRGVENQETYGHSVVLQVEMAKAKSGTWHTDYSAEAKTDFKRTVVECDQYIIADFDITDPANAAVNTGGELRTAVSGEQIIPQDTGLQRWFCSGNANIGIEAFDTLVPALLHMNYSVHAAPAPEDANYSKVIDIDANTKITWDVSGHDSGEIAIILYDVSQSGFPETEMPNTFIMTADDGEYILTPQSLRQFRAGQTVSITLHRSRMSWSAKAQCFYILSDGISEFGDYLLQ